MFARSCTAAVGSFLAVFYLSSFACKDDPCPFSAASRAYAHAGPEGAPVSLSAISLTSLARVALKLDRSEKASLLLSFYRCTLRSEWAVLALVAGVWASVAALAHLLVALVFGELRLAEVENMKSRALRYNLGKAFHMLYIIAAAEDGYHEFTVSTCWWALTGTMFLVLGLAGDRCTKLLQAQTVPLGKLACINALVLCQALFMVCAGFLWATAWRRHITTVFVFELFIIPSHIIRCLKQLIKYTVYIITELEDRVHSAAAGSDDDGTDPVPTALQVRFNRYYESDRLLTGFFVSIHDVPPSPL